MGYQSEQKQKNLSLILQKIHTDHAISRIDIAKSLEDDRSTVTGIIPGLIEIGLVVEKPQPPSGKEGRPPILLEINPQYGCVIGIAIHFYTYAMSILDLQGKELFFKKDNISAESTSFKELGLVLLEEACEYAEKTLNTPVLGASFAISGIVDPEKNAVVKSFVFRLDNFQFQQEIARHFPFPVVIENDANACAWGELFPRSDRASKKMGIKTSFLYLLARTTKHSEETHSDSGIGVGMGVVTDGQVFYGSYNQAGELRSAFWRFNSSGGTQVAIRNDDLLRIHEDERVRRQFIEEILLNLIPVTSIFDIGAIIFGGDLKKYLDVVNNVIRTNLKYTYLNHPDCHLSLREPMRGSSEISAGAACLFLHTLFFQSTPHKRRINWEHCLTIS